MKNVKWDLISNLHNDVMQFPVFISYSAFMHPNTFIYVVICYLCCSSSCTKPYEVVLQFLFFFRIITDNLESNSVWVVEIVSMCIIKYLSTINLMDEVFTENNLSDEFSASYDLSIVLFLILTKNLSLVFFQPTVYVNAFQFWLFTFCLLLLVIIHDLL